MHATVLSLRRGTPQQAVLLQTKEKVFGQLEEFINIGVDKYVFRRMCAFDRFCSTVELCCPSLVTRAISSTNRKSLISNQKMISSYPNVHL
jgi:hypothetical protein